MVQNAATRLVFNEPKRAHVKPLFVSLHWLPVAARIQFKTLMLAYKTTTGSAPTYFHSLLQIYIPPEAPPTSTHYYKSTSPPEAPPTSTHYYESTSPPEAPPTSTHYYKSTSPPEAPPTSTHYYESTSPPEAPPTSTHYYESTSPPEAPPTSTHYYESTSPPEAPPTSTHYYESTSPPDVWDLLVSNASWYHHREAQNHSPEHSRSPFLAGGMIFPPPSGMLDPCQSSSNNWKLISSTLDFIIKKK